MGVTTVAALTTRLRKDLWVRPPAFNGRPIDEILTVEGLSPSNDGKLLVEIVGAVAISCNNIAKNAPISRLIEKIKTQKYRNSWRNGEVYPY